ncbi:MAG: hypothetical protein Q4F21_01990 [Lachnospiraceae bacterium]|nr:hypothetical protein [Lachnospiraceae bacterium]
MKNQKLLLLGIATILFGICSILLSGLGGIPTYNNAIFELSGVICPIAGIVLAVVGFFMEDKRDR